MDESVWKDASKIWGMLDEMCEKDPQAYRRFVNKQMEEGKKMMTPPEPDFVIQTSIKNRLDCLYINVCSYVRVTEPKSDTDPISFFCTDIYYSNDDRNSDQIISVAAAPSVIQRYGKHGKKEEEKQGFIELIFEFLKAMKKIHTNGSWSVVNCLDLKGTPQQLYEHMKFDSSSLDGQMKDIATTFAPTESKDSAGLFNQVNEFISNKSSGEGASTFSKRTKGDELITPAPGLSHDATAKPKKVLIEEMPFEFPHTLSRVEDAKLGKAFVVDIALENVSSVKDCDLVISKSDLRLKTKSTKGSLEVKFPEAVNDAKARAQFKKKDAKLLITVPIASK